MLIERKLREVKVNLVFDFHLFSRSMYCQWKTTTITLFVYTLQPLLSSIFHEWNILISCLWFGWVAQNTFFLLFLSHDAQSRTHRMNWTHSEHIYGNYNCLWQQCKIGTRIDLLKLRNRLCFHFDSLFLSCDEENVIFIHFDEINDEADRSS